MAQRQFDTVTVETVQGDIANQPDLGAIVNAANAELRIGGGVAGAIHRAAGPGLEKECIPLGPIRPGKLLAEKKGIVAIGFPAISTGVFGYPVEEAAAVTLKAVVEVTPSLDAVRTIRFVLFGDADKAVFDEALMAL